ncbi:MAG: hypothetical protein U1E59_01155 [Amaricoccus sp.]
MRPLALAAALAGTLAAPLAAATTGDVATCLALYNQYDNAAWLYPNNHWNNRDGFQIMQPPELNRPMQGLINNGCLTTSSDIDGMPALLHQLSPHVIRDSGAAIRPTALHVGIVTGIYDEGRATQFFRGLGYRSRGVGALGLGRRIYIGPFTSQGALDEAIGIARQAGFISPYAAQHTRF